MTRQASPGLKENYAAATMLVVVVASLASSVPAFRAVRVDPAAVLRSE
jgi:ABC-type lipoprotein release transport system permease subunit